MKVPDSFKGFGIPRATKIIPLREETQAKFDHVLAAYIRQGHSKEEAINLVAISTCFHAMEKEGLQAGTDFRYDTATDALWFSAAANAFLAKRVPPDVMERAQRELGMLDPCEVQPDEIAWEGDEPFFSHRGFAKYLTSVAIGRDADANIEKAAHMAISVLTHSGLPESDAHELLENARQGESGAVERLIQRLEKGAQGWFSR
jgi:hypothetical protein